MLLALLLVLRKVMAMNKSVVLLNSRVFLWLGVVLGKMHNITFIIEGDSSAIKNAILRSLSVNYGSVY